MVLCIVADSIFTAFTATAIWALIHFYPTLSTDQKRGVIAVAIMFGLLLAFSICLTVATAVTNKTIKRMAERSRKERDFNNEIREGKND